MHNILSGRDSLRSNLKHEMGLVLKHLNLQPLLQPHHLWLEEDERLEAGVLRVVQPQLVQPGHHLSELGHLRYWFSATGPIYSIQ